MLAFVIGLIMFLAVLLIVVILPQSSKGGGITGSIGGANQLIGVKKTNDLLEKITWGLMISIFVLSLLTKAL